MQVVEWLCFFHSHSRAFKLSPVSLFLELYWHPYFLWKKLDYQFSIRLFLSGIMACVLDRESVRNV